MTGKHPGEEAVGHGRASFVSNTLWFTVLFGMGNVLSYVYVVIVGRQLTATQFGVFNALLGLITLAGVVANAVQTAVTSIAVRSPDRAALRAVNRRTAWMAVPAVVAVTLACLPLAPLIGADAVQVLVCGAVALAMQLSYPSIGFLLGLGLVREQAFIALAGTAVRLVVGLPLVMLSAGVAAALLGYLGNYLLVLAVALPLAWRRARTETAATATPASLQVDGRTLATYIAVFVPFSLDQTMVQLVAPGDGGAYAALSTMSKLVFFGAYPVIATAFAVLVGLNTLAAQLRHATTALKGVAVLAGAPAAALALFPELARRVFFGDRFVDAGPALPAMAFGVLGFTLSVFVAHLLIAWGNRWAAAASLAASAAGVVLYTLHHGSLDALVFNQCAAYALQLMLLGTLAAREITHRRRHQLEPTLV